MKRYLWLCSFFLGVCSLCYLYRLDVKTDVRVEYNSKMEDNLLKEKYSRLFEEFAWLKGDDEILDLKDDLFLSLKFLDALFSRDYTDYLALFESTGLKCRLKFDEYNYLCSRLDTFVSMSVLTKREFEDVLFYSLLLGKVSECSEYKKKAWIYGADSLSKMIVMHGDTFPTLNRFSKDQTKFVRLILEGLQFEGYLSKFQHNIAYNIGEECHLIKANLECFDLSFLMFICRVAGQYSKPGCDCLDISSGYFSYLKSFERDLFTHLQ
jgi:hypothetical protein